MFQWMCNSLRETTAGIGSPNLFVQIDQVSVTTEYLCEFVDNGEPS